MFFDLIPLVLNLRIEACVLKYNDRAIEHAKEYNYGLEYGCNHPYFDIPDVATFKEFSDLSKRAKKYTIDKEDKQKQVIVAMVILLGSIQYALMSYFLLLNSAWRCHDVPTLNNGNVF